MNYGECGKCGGKLGPIEKRGETVFYRRCENGHEEYQENRSLELIRLRNAGKSFIPKYER